jgi:hypothetical protein
MKWESTADLYARLTDEERAELSYQDRIKIEDRIFEEVRTSRYIRNAMTTVACILLALFVLYTSGGNGYGRYTADAYDWMETQ